jgi:uncharacterized YigZ family protein
MVEFYKTVYTCGSGEVIIKKSRFIATVSPAETEEAATQFIESMKKKYWDASHNCSAYVIGTDSPITHCSDDGEPAKTAGRPMLDILTAQNLTNIVVVVTRYFGGTLLGTGGLVRAYQAAVLEGLDQSAIITKQPGIRLMITTDYNYIGKIQYCIGQEQIPIISSEYLTIVKLTVVIPAVKKQEITKKITELTNGSAIFEDLGQIYFGYINHELHLFS